MTDAAAKRDGKRTSVNEHRRSRNKTKTLQELKQALVSLQSKNQKLSISAVAEEAGVDASTIHKVYPELAEEIRERAGTGSGKQRDRIQIELAEAKLTIKDLRDEIKRSNVDLAKIASLNETLAHENARLAAELADKVVTLRVKKRGEV